MRQIEIPKTVVLHGEKAINALYDFISELETQKPQELTEKQTAALIRVAKGLISSIEADKQLATSHQQKKKTLFGFLTHSAWLPILRKR